MKKNPLQDDNMWKGASPKIFANAKSLRANPTQAEESLWLALKDNQLEGYKFRRQHPLLIYIADFYCHQLKLVIEIDGGYHQTSEQQKIDKERTANIEGNGIQVVRFTNEEVLGNMSDVLARIREYIKSK